MTGAVWHRLQALAAVATILLSSSSSTTTNLCRAEETANDDDNNNQQQQCGLYLAVSSTSTADDDATKWGMFVGRPVEKGDAIGSPQVGITIPHLRANNKKNNDNDDNTNINDKVVDFFEEFFWVPGTAGAPTEIAPGGRSIAAIPGAGVLASYSAKRTNADWSYRSAYYNQYNQQQQQDDDTDATASSGSSAHSLRGATSPFYNISVVATALVPAGGEVFLEYGDSWAEQEGEDDLTPDDFTKIDETIAQMIAFFAKHEDSLDMESTYEIYSFLTKDIMKAAIGSAKARKVSALLPPNPKDLHLVPQAGGALVYSNPTAHRSLDWLQKYGLCMDNIRMGPATTAPNKNVGGRGAIATRHIAAGSLVAPVPLVHIPNHDVLNMYKLEEQPSDGSDKSNLGPESDQVISQQLLLNYCFGHPSSTMLLFPTGSAVAFINHADVPNAKLVWSQHPNHQKLWLKQDPETELFDEDHLFLGLVMEVVALRDISPEEEVFLDYGPEWRAAYAQHVATWEEKVSKGTLPAEWPRRAVDWNAQYQPSLSSSGQVFMTRDEAKDAPTPLYSDNVQLKAFLLLQDSDNAGTIDDPKQWDKDSSDLEIYHHDHLFDITILQRNNNDSIAASDSTYTVEWVNKKGITTVVAGVPHAAMLFVDKSDTSDTIFAMEHAFRHYIGIPDEIFPTGPWRNRLKPKMQK